jgi:hypothetical protein
MEQRIELKEKSGIFKISPYELEQMSGEFAEINNIIALAKADDGIKKLLLAEVLNEFADDLQFETPIITDEKLEKVIDGVTESVNENIEVEGVRNADNVECYGFIPEWRMKETKDWIRKELGI